MWYALYKTEYNGNVFSLTHWPTPYNGGWVIAHRLNPTTEKAPAMAVWMYSRGFSPRGDGVLCGSPSILPGMQPGQGTASVGFVSCPLTFLEGVSCVVSQDDSLVYAIAEEMDQWCCIKRALRCPSVDLTRC